eukprot:gene13219-27963_t
MDNSDLTRSFEVLVNSIDHEVRVLKSIADLQSIPRGNLPKEIEQKIANMEVVITELEQTLDDFNNHVDIETKSMERLQYLSQFTKVQLYQFRALQLQTPSFLVKQSKENIGLSSNSNIPVSEQNLLSNGVDVMKKIKNSAQTSGHVADTVKTKEFEAVPKSTRGRLTLTQINEYFFLMMELITRKEKLLKNTKKSRRQDSVEIFELENKRVPEHEGAAFVTETEIRGTKIFENGVTTGVSVLHTLRALHRIRLVRTSGESTYVL